MVGRQDVFKKEAKDFIVVMIKLVMLREKSAKVDQLQNNKNK